MARKNIEPAVPELDAEDAAFVAVQSKIEHAAEEIVAKWNTTADAATGDRVPPVMDHLEDAIVQLDDGTPVFILDVGDEVLIERWLNPPDLPCRTWLDTRLYTIQRVDQDTGRIELYDEGLHQCAMSNFKTGLARGYTFKVPEGGLAGIKKRRKVRRKNSRKK